MSKTKKLVQALVFVAALAVTVYFALFRRFLPDTLPEAVRGNGDHNLHMLAFFCLTVILLSWSRSAMRSGLFVAALAVTLEALQIWLPERGANLDDLLASLIGVGLGLALGVVVQLTIRRFTQSPR